MSVLSVTDLVDGTVTRDSKGLHFGIGALSTVYAISLLLLLIVGVVKLARVMKHSTYVVRQQIKFIMFGFIVSVVVGVLLNIIIPNIISNFGTAQFGPLFTVALVALFTYAIIRHKLFDIRLAVARLVAYTLTVFLIALLYIIPTVLLARYVLHVPLHNGSIITLIIITFIAAITFQPLRQWFNKITNRIFYRDYYEPQDVLDQLSNLLVGSIELEHIINGSSKTLQQALQPTSFNYLLEGGELKDNDKAFLTELKNTRTNVIVSDEIEQDSNPTLIKTMQDNNIAVAVRLHTSKGDLGFMVLGYKQSGSIYNDIDKRTLSIAADEIAISLQNALHFEEIQKFNVTLQEKIDEATHNLRKANERLKALDETKDDFISMASHQLRTPLTSMKGYVSMVLDGDAGKLSEQQRKLLNQAFASSQNMVFLIADLLNVSRLKSGKFVIENTPTNLAKMIEAEVSQLNELLEAHELKLTYDKPEHFPDLMLDENKIRQVIMNFIDNAIYYTPKGGHIDVKLVDKPDSVEFTVNDDGIGVPKAVQHHLFTKFYRADNAKKTRPDGTGLGLFMAQKVVIAQGGAIIFSSREGKGSTFGFHLPKSKVAVKNIKEQTAKKTTDDSTPK